MPGKRWAAKRLAEIHSGLGAARLAPDVTGLTLWIGKDNRNGQMGYRKFWRQHLPRIQFYNPRLSITVQRIITTKEHDKPAALYIHRSAYKNIQHIHELTSPNQCIHNTVSGTSIIDMQYKRSDEICRALLEQAGAAENAVQDVEKQKSE
ncbi:hypothetical protein PORY_000985 [Pneumocystis oryctolagi]|uniref:Uncharacterized protein n=1 Tax=Pneumocystis oryctolagi TaxID=42067 RepID=A0ACB7CEX1_9ASCO|nr:hypothetical protein PORY_000985 [Pneumocystis oryctolagi]